MPAKRLFISAEQLKEKKIIKTKVQSSILFFVRINELTIINKLTSKQHYL